MKNSFEASDTAVELNLFPAKPAAIRNEDNGVSTSPEFPDSLIEPLETALDEAESWLVKNQPAEFPRSPARACISGCIHSGARLNFTMSAS